MRVERLADNKVKIFISYDDLEKRGIDREEMWQNGRKVQELFWDMMEYAYAEVGFEVAGPISIEAFTMPTEGIIVIVTQVPSLPLGQYEEEDGDDQEETFEVQVNMTSVVVVFFDFEDVIRAAAAIGDHADIKSTLYANDQKYYLYIHEDEMEEEWFESVWTILLEYGAHSNVTKAFLDDYGKVIVDGYPFLTILRYFS
ncbi:adaptor protein MecA [Fodinisporobacter ferrooxydans]|uniref:Adaptor protein MecA n=1 Tax=Fodinisporobacter ferrooxydans TaxID=2901836 RepID=A0ABY4CGW4_9BACL|nr:adaptor protein MecA [Alicyclobacillaceae bacterium MYW30-H2]